MFCGHCGGRQADGRFCTTCGRPLDELPRQAIAPQRVAEAATWERPVASLPLYQPATPLAAEASGPPVATLAGAPPRATTNVAVNVAGPQILYQDTSGPGLVVRAIWFVFIGWWIGAFWIGLAWALNLTIIGLPLGLMMFNAVPKVMTLKSRTVHLSMSQNADGTYLLKRSHVDQRRFWVRAVYFLVIGCWFSLLWAYAAYAIGLLILTLPISFWMFDRLPAVTTLARY